jgi:hypothetical protein
MRCYLMRGGQRKAVVEADDWEGPEFGVCANAASICRAFETSRRREHLTFKHHAEVASLPAPEADALLDWAERNPFASLATLARHASCAAKCQKGASPLARSHPLTHAQHGQTYRRSA